MVDITTVIPSRSKWRILWIISDGVSVLALVRFTDKISLSLLTPITSVAGHVPMLPLFLFLCCMSTLPSASESGVERP